MKSELKDTIYIDKIEKVENRIILEGQETKISISLNEFISLAKLVEKSDNIDFTKDEIDMGNMWVKILKENPRITLSELSKLTHVPLTTLHDRIKTLFKNYRPYLMVIDKKTGMAVKIVEVCFSGKRREIINERRNNIITEMRDNPRISTQEIAKNIGSYATTVWKDIQTITEKYEFNMVLRHKQ
ncbi:MAG: winged helix-turn-helix transcriptional regulator [Nanoarchaeota archaeon]|nr:winged helix-turn-helix transcriptional regulator [Nanoarchaeota archaeon]